jgi:hypothetical protein
MNCIVKKSKASEITDETAFLTHDENAQWDDFKRPSETHAKAFWSLMSWSSFGGASE